MVVPCGHRRFTRGYRIGVTSEVVGVKISNFSALAQQLLKYYKLYGIIKGVRIC